MHALAAIHALAKGAANPLAHFLTEVRLRVQVFAEILGDRANDWHGQPDGAENGRRDVSDEFGNGRFAGQSIVQANAESLARRNFSQRIERVATITKIEIRIVLLAVRLQQFPR